MRIAIVSTPRTCSSVLGQLFASKHELTDKSEIFSSIDTDEEAIKILDSLKTEDNYTVKLTTTSFNTFESIKYDTFPWEIFDKIVLTERDDLIAQYSSWLLLSHAQRNNIKSSTEIYTFINNLIESEEKIVIQQYELKSIINNIDFYHTNTKPFLLQNQNLNVKVVKYELLQGNPEEYFVQLNQILDESFTTENIDDKLKSGLNYKKFAELHELEQLISSL